MGMSDRARGKGLEKTAQLLPPGTTLRGYSYGTAQARLSTPAVIAIGAFVAVFAVMLFVRGVTLIPGFVFLYYLKRSILPLRGIAVADQGVALLDLSFFHAYPKKVLALIPLDWAVHGIDPDSRRVAIGPEAVSLRRHERERYLDYLGLRAPLTATPARPT
jgi:hypothetical protein